MFEGIRAVLVLIALVIVALPVPARQPATSAAARESTPRETRLPDCSWTTKTQWAQGEARLVRPTGGDAGPIVADLVFRYDARKALENEAQGRQILLALSRPHAATAMAPTMSFRDRPSAS